MKRYLDVARHLDDSALTALGNRGLLRRATKDLERIEVSIDDPEAEPLRVRLDAVTVTLDLQPAASRCSCPASGACRHLIAAWLHLAELSREEAASTPPDAGPATVQPEILALDDEAIRRYGGKALERKALRELAAGLEVKLDEASSSLRVPEWNVSVRWLPGAGLAGTLCSCHAREACLHRIVAVLGFQLAAGQRSLDFEDDGLQASTETPRSRGEIIDATRTALLDVIEPGLCRLSRASVAHLQALGTAAHGVDLPRLERVLRSLARELDALLQRAGHASADTAARRAASTEALCVALARPTPGIVGRHRGRFVRVGNLELIGLGARQFATASGYRGLLCYFWDQESGRLCTWSDVRHGTTDPSFDPVHRYGSPGPWPGCPNPAAASTHAFRLTGAWRSLTGRLSARDGVRYVRSGPSPVATVPALTNWSAVAARARTAWASGLAEGSELATVVHLRPARWHRGGFDVVAQRWTASIEDEVGVTLELRLAYSPQHATAIDRLEAASLGSFSSLLGEVVIESGELVVVPFSFFADDSIFSPTLSTWGGSPTRERPDAPPSTDEVELDEVHDVDVAFGPLGAACNQLRQELVDLAERGTRGHVRPELTALATRLSRNGGLRLLETSLTRLAAAGDSRTRARALLQGLHVCETVSRILSVEQALE